MKIFSSPQIGAHIVATIVVLGFVALVSVLAVHVVQESTIMISMATALATKFGSVVDFYMGSSMGSAQKTAQISHLIGQTSNPPAPAAGVAQPGA